MTFKTKLTYAALIIFFSLMVVFGFLTDNPKRDNVWESLSGSPYTAALLSQLNASNAQPNPISADNQFSEPPSAAKNPPLAQFLFQLAELVPSVPNNAPVQLPLPIPIAPETAAKSPSKTNIEETPLLKQLLTKLAEIVPDGPLSIAKEKLFNPDFTTAATIPGTALAFSVEQFDGLNVHALTLTNPNNFVPDYKWQFLANGLRFFTNKKQGTGWEPLIAEIRIVPEYKKQQGSPGKFVWQPYALESNTSGMNILQGWKKQGQTDGSVKLVRAFRTFEEGVEEIFTETWIIPATAEEITTKGIKTSASMTKNRGIALVQGVAEGAWRVKWKISGISDINSNSYDLKDSGGKRLRKKSYAGFTIDWNDFDEYLAGFNGGKPNTDYVFSEIAPNKAELLAYENGTTGDRIFDPTLAVSAAAAGWTHNKMRNVFYNGSNFFLLYTKANGNIFYKASSDNVIWTGENTLISNQSATDTEFDLYLVDDTKFDLVYENNAAATKVVTVTISGQTLTAGTASASANSTNCDSVATSRTISANRIFLVCRNTAELEVYSANQTGDANNITTWTGEVTTEEAFLAGNVTAVPYNNSDKVLVIFQKNPGGTASDGIYSRAIVRAGGPGTAIEIGNLNDIGVLANAVRVSDDDFRYILTKSGAVMEEYKWDDSAWNSVAVIDTETDQANPSLFYDRQTGDLYIFSIDSGTSEVERHSKSNGGSWGIEISADSAETGARSLPITQMHQPPYGASRNQPFQLVWAYRVANGANFDLNVGSTALTPPAFNQSSYRWFENIAFDIDGAVIADVVAGADRARAVAADADFLYIAGECYSGCGPLGLQAWRIEKRNKHDGSLVTAFDGDGVIVVDPTASIDIARAIAVDDNFLYTVGNCFNCGTAGDYAWRIEKRNKHDGSLVTAFDGDGIVISDPTGKADVPNEIVIDDNFIYIAGYCTDDPSTCTSASAAWRIEKRNKSDGALVTAFDGDGVVISNPTNGFDEAIGIAGDTNFLYIVGQCDNRCGPTGGVAWRIEKRNKSDGALVTAFDGDGIAVSDPTNNADRAMDVTVDASFVYIAGDCFGCGPTGGFSWRIEKRDITSGALVTAFDGDGALISDLTVGEDMPSSITTDSNFIYIVGDCDGCGLSGGKAWQIEKRNKSDGSLVTAFDGDGIVLSDSTANFDEAFDVIVDANFLYVVGDCDGCGAVGGDAWRIEKRDLTYGTLTSVASVGSPLSDQNTLAFIPPQGTAFRLRMLLHLGIAALAQSGESFKLQFAERIGACDAGFAGETYADVTSVSGAIRYFGNTGAADSDNLNASGRDPTHSAHAVVNQTYEETNNFTNSAAVILTGQDGQWDFVLVDNSAPKGTGYCFRIVKSDGALLNTYNVVPEIITADQTVSLVTADISPGWTHNKMRNVFYNGSNFFLLYTKANGNIFYKASSDNITWTGENTLITNQSTGNTEFDLYLVDDAKFDLVYENNAAATKVVTVTISGQTLTAGTASASANAANCDSVATARTASANRIFVVCRNAAELEVYSANQTGDSGSITAWTGEITTEESDLVGGVTVMPYNSSDKVLVLYQRDPAGTISDGIFSRAMTRAAGAGTAIQLASIGEAGTLSNAVRISDTDFRYILRKSPGTADTIKEYKWNNSSWTNLGDVDTETDQEYPSVLYDRRDGTLYVVSLDTGYDDIELHKKTNSQWETETVIDGVEANTHSFPTVQMYEPPEGSSRNSPRQIVWVYRVTAGSFGLKVGKKEKSTFNQSVYRWFGNVNSTDVGSPFAAQDTATTTQIAGTQFRLRLLLHIDDKVLTKSEGDFKLQFAVRSGACDTGFAGETYTDVSPSAGDIRYFNNSIPADGENLTANANDPIHGADPIINQTYEEANNFTNSVDKIKAGEDGKWDFSLVDNSSPAGTTYCFRVVRVNGTVLDTYTVIPEITIAGAAPALTQNFFRFYVNNDALDPTDPWPVGVADLGENAAIIAGDTPPVSGEILRIRMSIQTSNADLTSGSQAFKLQFGVRISTCNSIAIWDDLGATSSTAIWRGFDATPTDGTALSGNPPTAGDLNLSVSDRAGTYEEANNTALNPFTVFVGEDAEYDWVVQNNGAAGATAYCFRMTKADGITLAGYNFYPTLITPGYQPKSQNWRWYDDETNETPIASLAAENVAPANIANQNIIKLRITIKETGGAAGVDIKFKLQFSTVSDFSSDVNDAVEIGSCVSNSLWCFADGEGVDNAIITTKVLSDADACSGGVGNGCGTHNESGTSASVFDPPANAATEFEFTIKHAGARENQTYFFRPFDISNNQAVPLNTGEIFPSLSTKGAVLTFTISGLGIGIATEGITTDAATTPASIAFGSLSFDIQTEAAQRLIITTNATEGYQIFVFQQQGFLNSDYGAMDIDPVTGTNESPVSWTIGCASTAAGCYGYHAGDDILAGGSVRFAPNDTYAQFETTAKEIAFSSGPVTSEATDIVFKTLITNQQEAGDYENSVAYIVVPIF